VNILRASLVYSENNMSHSVCPWWLGYYLISPLRRWLGDAPGDIVGPHVRERMTVLEPGPGMGFFTLELARLVGPSGRVIAIDVQAKMLDKLKARAVRAQLLERIEIRLASADSMGLSGLGRVVDFTLAFAMLHEVPSAGSFLSEVSQVSKSGPELLLCEPAGHVKDEEFANEVQLAAQAGFEVAHRPSIRRSHAALLKKK
jgi:ubiquinone/menaquinone biosynthesis C-methylase UbiE